MMIPGEKGAHPGHLGVMQCPRVIRFAVRCSPLQDYLLRAKCPEIPRERDGGRVPFTEEQLAAMGGGLGVEDYCWKLIRAVVDSEPTPD